MIQFLSEQIKLC